MSRLHVVRTWEGHVYVVDAENAEQACMKVRGQYDPPLGDEDVYYEAPLSQITRTVRNDGLVNLNL